MVKRIIPQTCGHCRTDYLAFDSPKTKLDGGFCSRKCMFANKGTIQERFDKQAVKGDGCWGWRGRFNRKGYPVISHNGRQQTAHRISYLLANGPIPDGMCVCHSCDNPPCTNPAHLWLGTHADNVADKVRKGRQAVGDASGPRQHPERLPRGSAHKRAKLTEQQVGEIKDLLRQGVGLLKIAHRYGVGFQNISHIKLGHTWRHVK